MKPIVVCLSLLFIVPATFSQKSGAFNTNDYVRALKYSTDIMVNDVTSPVAAASTNRAVNRRLLSSSMDGPL